MRTLIEIIAGLAILANAVIYGTDVFGAIIQRPAIAAVDDRTLTQAVTAWAAMSAHAGPWPLRHTGLNPDPGRDCGGRSGSSWARPWPGPPKSAARP